MSNNTTEWSVTFEPIEFTLNDGTVLLFETEPERDEAINIYESYHIDCDETKFIFALRYAEIPFEVKEGKIYEYE